jgi:RecA/RadA recombinase
MTATKIDTGSRDLDGLLHDGITRSGITSIYGEAGAGKTTIALQITRQTAMQGLKVLYVDSDHSFTQQRFQQMTGANFQNLSELVMLFFPEDFEEQRILFESLENFLTPTVGLVVVDSMSSLYRAAFSSNNNIFKLNRVLTRQLAYLSELSMTRKIACLITSQVHAKFTGPISQIEPVARRALFHFPKSIIRLRNTPSSNVKECIVERDEGIDVLNRRCILALTDSGFTDLQR